MRCVLAGVPPAASLLCHGAVDFALTRAPVQITVVFVADLAACLPTEAAWPDLWHENQSFLLQKDAHDKAAEAAVSPCLLRCSRWLLAASHQPSCYLAQPCVVSRASRHCCWDPMRAWSCCRPRSSLSHLCLPGHWPEALSRTACAVDGGCTQPSSCFLRLTCLCTATLTTACLVQRAAAKAEAEVKRKADEAPAPLCIIWPFFIPPASLNASQRQLPAYLILDNEHMCAACDSQGTG